MPVLTLRYSIPADSAALPGQLAAAATAITAEQLGKRAEVTAVLVERVPPQQWFIGGASLAERGKASALVDITVTRGTNTREQMAAFIVATQAAMVRILGPLEAASYVRVREEMAENWGYDGVTQALRPHLK